jgi:A/G-specific adenine glycosylase
MAKRIRTPRAYQLTPDERDRTRRIALALTSWARKHLRDFPWRRFRTDYEVLVAETLLQRTRADVVARFLPDFLREYPDWESLASVEPDRLVSRLEVLGLQVRRSQSLRAMAIAQLRGDSQLPGVGQYIERARAVMVTNAGLAMVDSNFVRVLRRAFESPWGSDYRYDARMQALALAIVQSGGDARTTNMALLDLGSLVCVPRNPRCERCPILITCTYGSARVREMRELD